MTDIFRKSILESYNPDHADLAFATAVNAAINKHFNELSPSKSTIDPLRLGSKAVFYAKLRQSLLEKAGSYEIDNQPQFNKLTTSEQLRFQAQSRDYKTNAWVHDLEILPPVVNAIHMNDREVTALKALRSAADVAKLRENVVDIDADAIIALLLPSLVDPANNKLMAVISALLLATGRRTTEIVKTANFYLGPNHTNDGYKCMFSGQLKEGLHETKPYAIPLLAPFYLVRNALDLIRKEVNTTRMTPVECNEQFGKPMNNYLNSVANMNPHGLRAIYALTTFAELPENARPALVGWVGQVLGHIQPANAIYYTRLRIVNFTSHYVPPRAAVLEDDIDDNEEDEADDWVISCAADRKRVTSIQEMMVRRKRVTASSVRTFAGGTMTVISRVIAANKERIDAYNASLD